MTDTAASPKKQDLLKSVSLDVKQEDGTIARRKFKATVIERRVKPQQQEEDGVQVDRQDQTGQSQFKDPKKLSWSLDAKLIPPPYNQLRLTQLEEDSTALREPVDAMATNIEGFGFFFRKRPMSEEFAKQNKKEIDKEKRRLNALFKVICVDESLTSCRKKTRRSEELTGNGYWEIVRGINKSVEQIVHLPSHEFVLSQLDEEFTTYPVKTIDPETFEIKEVDRKKRFRRIVQVDKAGKALVWFKEYGDNRIISKTTGEVETEEKPVKVDDRASEVVHFKKHSDRSPYGIPTWIGRYKNVESSIQAEEINFFSMQNYLPSAWILLENGELTEGSVQRLEDLVSGNIASDPNFTKYIILEAESGDSPEMIPGTTGVPKITIVPFHKERVTDQMYKDLDKDNRAKVVQSWRIPNIFLGRDTSYTKANLVTSRQMGDEQVFGPERDDGDFFMNRLVLDKGIESRFHEFKTRTPNVTDNRELVAMVAASEKSGAVTPRVARAILEDVFEAPLGDLPKLINPDVPYSLQFAQAQNAQLPPEPEKKERSGEFEFDLQEYINHLIEQTADEDEEEESN